MPYRRTARLDRLGAVLKVGAVQAEWLIDPSWGEQNAIPAEDVRVDCVNNGGVSRDWPVHHLQWTICVISMDEEPSGGSCWVSGTEVGHRAFTQPIELIDCVV